MNPEPLSLRLEGLQEDATQGRLARPHLSQHEIQPPAEPNGDLKLLEALLISGGQIEKARIRGVGERLALQMKDLVILHCFHARGMVTSRMAVRAHGCAPLQHYLMASASVSSRHRETSMEKPQGSP